MPGGARNGISGLSGERHLHEVAEDRRRVMRRLRRIAERARLIIAHEYADGEIGRVADEPEILGVVGRAGLASEVLADFLDRLTGAALDDAFHDRGDLIGGERIEHLLALID